MPAVHSRWYILDEHDSSAKFCKRDVRNSWRTSFLNGMDLDGEIRQSMESTLLSTATLSTCAVCGNKSNPFTLPQWLDFEYNYPGDAHAYFSRFCWCQTQAACYDASDEAHLHLHLLRRFSTLELFRSRNYVGISDSPGPRCAYQGQGVERLGFGSGTRRLVMLVVGTPAQLPRLDRCEDDTGQLCIQTHNRFTSRDLRSRIGTQPSDAAQVCQRGGSKKRQVKLTDLPHRTELDPTHTCVADSSKRPRSTCRNGYDWHRMEVGMRVKMRAVEIERGSHRRGEHRNTHDLVNILATPWLRYARSATDATGSNESSVSIERLPRSPILGADAGFSLGPITHSFAEGEATSTSGAAHTMRPTPRVP
ncbi:hypothetical protein DFP72DRAFT_850569 [Ephemerocybe angulata]|uniref:Uncharacterized protein n=1 Tax=Ephemerocybe angulata TaxID=980116 RepID=A0A8H6M525_9AGAR|nr:hypothetical protein DFP72DRAFT_850569 [Tulosesus angulatus]